MASRVGFGAVRIGVIVLILAFGTLGALVYAGAYDIAADSPHFALVERLLGIVRNRSIAVRAADVAAPGDLGDAKRIAAGASLYNEMCSGCHLAPGIDRTEISKGLYPRAPELSRGSGLGPEQEFWVIKHGVKMTGMAAWGATHDDTLIWNMVAFLRKLPSLSPADYRAATETASEDHDHMMHEHMDKDDRPHK